MKIRKSNFTDEQIRQINWPPIPQLKYALIDDNGNIAGAASTMDGIEQGYEILKGVLGDKIDKLSLVVKPTSHYHDPNLKCPNCNKGIEEATGINASVKPKEGDVSICIYCSSINKFNKDLTLRIANEADIAELKEDKEGWEIIGKIIQDVEKIMD